MPTPEQGKQGAGVPQTGGGRKKNSVLPPPDMKKYAQAFVKAPEEKSAGVSRKNKHRLFASGLAVSEKLHPLPYYWGTIERAEVERILKKEGEFLVRVKNMIENPEVVLSHFWDGKLRHHVIYEEDSKQDQYNLGGLAYYTCDKMVTKYMKEKIPLPIGQEKPGNKGPPILLIPKTLDQPKLQYANYTFVEPLIFESDAHTTHQAKFTGPCPRRAGLDCENICIKMWWNIHKDTNDVYQLSRSTLKANYDILCQLSHPNIAKMLAIDTVSEWVWTGMEFFPNYSLDHLLHDPTAGEFHAPSSLLQFCVDAASGMEYLESVSCFHGALCAKNCMVVDNKRNIKLSDYGGVSQFLDWCVLGRNERYIKWSAPEELAKFDTSSFDPTPFERHYYIKSDIFSLGILIWEIISRGGIPYRHMDNRSASVYVLNGCRMDPKADLRHPFSRNQQIHKLMTNCWETKPDERPKFKEIKRILEEEKTKLQPM